MLRLGITVTILTIAVDPFSQQLVQLNQRFQYMDEVNGTKAASPFTYNYTLGTVEIVESLESPEADSLPISIVAARPDAGMEIAVLGILMRPMDTVQPGQSPSRCPSSQCEWDAFQTLGVCHRCNDITKDLTRVDNFTDFFDHVEEMKPFGFGLWLGEDATAFLLPNGHFLPNFFGCFQYIKDKENPVCPLHVIAGGTPTFLMTSHGTGNPNKTVSMRDIDTLIWSMSIIQIEEFEEGTPEVIIKDIDHHIHGQTRVKGPWDDWPDTPVRATECALYYCVKSMEPRVEAHVVNDGAKEVQGMKRLQSSWGVVGGKNDSVAPENIPKHPDSLEFDNKTSFLTREPLALYSPDENPPRRMYNITSNGVFSISALFQDLLREEWDANGTTLKLVREEYAPDAAVMFNGWAEMEGMRPQRLGGLWERPSTNVAARFENLAASMTNEFRNIDMLLNRPNYWEGEYFSTTRGEVAEGRVGVQTTLYRIEWYWILLHGMILLGGVAFCTATWALSAATGPSGEGIPAWKNHSLAAVSQGTHLAVADIIGGAVTTKEMEKTAQGGAVSLVAAEKAPLLPGSDNEEDPRRRASDD
jgi:hypothetical protein